ncbi:MAG: hypoxanthine phosphoribosyltransferase [Acidobacteriota bacterium]
MSAFSPSRPRVLISTDALRQRVAELAAEIQHDYRDRERIIAVGVLKGSVFFLSDLLQQIDLPISVDFFQTSSYGDQTESDDVRIIKDLDGSVSGAHVLLIEDIVDTGKTLRTVLDLLKFRRAASVKLCTLLDKQARRQVDVPIHYCGFEIDDHFVVGYGLDHAGLYRNLPYIGVYEGGGA